MRVWSVRSGESAICLQAKFGTHVSTAAVRLVWLDPRGGDLPGDWQAGRALDRCQRHGRSLGHVRPDDPPRASDGAVADAVADCGSIAAFVIAWILVSQAILTERPPDVQAIAASLLVLGSLFVAEVVVWICPTAIGPSLAYCSGQYRSRILIGSAIVPFWSSDPSVVIERGIELLGLFAAQAFVLAARCSSCDGAACGWSPPSRRRRNRATEHRSGGFQPPRGQDAPATFRRHRIAAIDRRR